MGEYAAELAIEYLEKKDREVRDEQCLHTRSDEEVETKLVVLHARTRAHVPQFTVGNRARQSAVSATAEAPEGMLLKVLRRAP